MPPTRRQLLAVASAALAGCTGLPDSGSAATDSTPLRTEDGRTPAGAPTVSRTDTPTTRVAATTRPATTASETPSPTATPIATPTTLAMGETYERDGVAVTVTSPRVQKLAVEDVGIWQTLVARDGQFLLVDVTVDGALEELPLGVGFDGGPPRWTEWFIAGRAEDGDFPGDEPANFENTTLALPAPVREGDAAVVLPLDGTARWPLDDGIESRLASAPVFTIESFQVRFVGREGDLRVFETTFSVRNDGDRDGRFLAQISRTDLHDASTIVGFDVPVGESVTRTFRPSSLETFRREITVTVRSVRDIERSVAAPTPTETATNTVTDSS